MKYLIGTDIGTSGTKSIVMSTEGELVGSALEEYGVMTPRALWAEQWPQPWVAASHATIRQAVEASGVAPADVAGICVSGLYGGSGVPLDADMRPVRPCMIWMDRRASDISAKVVAEIGSERLYTVAKNGYDPYYGYIKIGWIKEHEPENWKKTALFLSPNAYVIYTLTGEVAMDYSSAGNLGGVFDMEKRCWSEEMLGLLGIPLSKMPQRLVPSSEVVGGLTQEAAGRLGLLPGTPVCAGGVDCTVATLGLGVMEPGQQVATIGTSMTWGMVHTGDRLSPELITMPYVKDAKELLFTFGGAATAGALIRWFRNEFAGLELQNEKEGGESAYRVLDRQTEALSPGSDGLLVLPYFMGERAPIWNVDARGTIFGLSLAHTRAHVYRAFLESVAYSLLHSMENVSGAVGTDLILAGGVVKSPLWRQIFADVTGCKIITPKIDAEANLGDVMLAGVGTGVLTYEQLKRWRVFDAPVLPNARNHGAYQAYYTQYKALYESLEGNMADMACLAAKG